MEKIKKTIERWCYEGMDWPFLYDPVEDKPSITLMFFYISFIISTIAISVSSFYLIKNDRLLEATIMPTIHLILGFVFYRLRKLDSFKIDIDDRSIELSNENKGEKE